MWGKARKLRRLVTLERRLLWIREFESSRPSHAVRSPVCDFRVRENRRHSRVLGWRARVSGRQILDFRLWTGGFAAPVSARHFPISVSACPRPVRVGRANESPAGTGAPRISEIHDWSERGRSPRDCGARLRRRCKHRPRSAGASGQPLHHRHARRLDRPRVTALRQLHAAATISPTRPATPSTPCSPPPATASAASSPGSASCCSES
jgi:hypothetical protein